MKYIIDHIPKNTPHNRRPQLDMETEYLTIHNNGNPNSTAQNERDWLTNPSNTRTASYHIVIDEHEAIECVPLNEATWNAGDGYYGDGNRKSISIEICEHGDYQKTLSNAVELVAKMLMERGWGIERLRRHYDWSEKICPRLMYDNGTWKGWYDFKEMVDDAMRKYIDGEAQIRLNGKLYDAVIIDGKTYAPIRETYEDIGYRVTWNNEEKIVDIIK